MFVFEKLHIDSDSESLDSTAYKLCSQFTFEDDSDQPISSKDELFPFDQNLCIMHLNDERGRFVQSRDVIPYGTYLMIERAVSVVYTNEENDGEFCHNCHHKINKSTKEQKTTIPCRSCNQSTFCSVDCENMANTQGFHRVECGLADAFADTPFARHAFRLLALIGLENIVRFYEKEARRESCPFSVWHYLQDSSSDDPLYRMRFEDMNVEQKLKIFSIINSFVEHDSDDSLEVSVPARVDKNVGDNTNGQMDDDSITNMQELAIQIVLTVNQQERKFVMIQPASPLFDYSFRLLRQHAAR